MDAMSFLKPCLGCNDGATNQDAILHNVEDCKVWKSLSVKDRQVIVQSIKHPFANHQTASCNNPVRACKICSDNLHHFQLCSKKKMASNVCVTMSLIGSGDSDLPITVQTSFVQTELGSTRLGAMWDLVRLITIS